MVSPALSSLLDTLRRRWPVVAVTVLVAVAVAIVLAVRDAPLYTATATVTVEPTVFTRMPTLTGPERVIRDVQTAEYYERVAERAGVLDARSIRQGMRSYTTGTPPQALVVAFTGGDRAVAERVAEAGAQVAYERAQAFNAVERERQQAVAESARVALVALDAEGGSTPWERSDVAVKRATMEQSLAAATYALALIDRAYALEKGVAVAERSATRAVVEAAAGALVLGVVAGTGLAVVSDRVVRRHGRDS